jgi:hypothetical protein
MREEAGQCVLLQNRLKPKWAALEVLCNSENCGALSHLGFAGAKVLRAITSDVARFQGQNPRGAREHAATRAHKTE